MTPYVTGMYVARSASETVEDYARRRTGAEARVIEETIERALQGGMFGVRVWRYDEGLSAQVDSTVPYGHIYEMPHGRRPPEDGRSDG